MIAHAWETAKLNFLGKRYFQMLLAIKHKYVMLSRVAATMKNVYTKTKRKIKPAKTTYVAALGNFEVLNYIQNGGPIYATANNLPLRGDKGSLWEGGTKGAAFVYSETLLKKSKYENTEYVYKL